jgi:hypothetical protein
MGNSLVEIARQEALLNTLKPNWDSFWRKVSRYYSEKWNTPLHEVVYEMDPYFVILNYFEDHFSDLDERQKQEQLRLATETEDERKKREMQEEQEDIEFLKMAAEEEEKKDKVDYKKLAEEVRKDKVIRKVSDEEIKIDMVDELDLTKQPF